MSEGEVQSVAVKLTKENDMAKQKFVTKKEFDDFKKEFDDFKKDFDDFKEETNRKLDRMMDILMKSARQPNENIPKQDKGTMNKKLNYWSN